MEKYQQANEHYSQGDYQQAESATHVIDAASRRLIISGRSIMLAIGIVICFALLFVGRKMDLLNPYPILGGVYAVMFVCSVILQKKATAPDTRRECGLATLIIGSNAALGLYIGASL